MFTSASPQEAAKLCRQISFAGANVHDLVIVTHGLGVWIIDDM